MCTQGSRRPSIKVLDGPWSVLKDEDTTSTQHGTSSQAQASRTPVPDAETRQEEAIRKKDPEKQETGIAAADSAGISKYKVYETLAPMLLMIIAIALVRSSSDRFTLTSMKKLLNQVGRVRLPNYHARNHGHFRFHKDGRLVRGMLPPGIWGDISYFHRIVFHFNEEMGLLDTVTDLHGHFYRRRFMFIPNSQQRGHTDRQNTFGSWGSWVKFWFRLCLHAVPAR